MRSATSSPAPSHGNNVTDCPIGSSTSTVNAVDELVEKRLLMSRERFVSTRVGTRMAGRTWRMSDSVYRTTLTAVVGPVAERL